MKTSKTPRLRVLRAIEPNAGLSVECAKKIGKALKDLSGALSAQALECFQEGDAFMSRPDFMSMVAAEMRRMPEAEGLLGQFTADAAPPELIQDAWLTQRQRNALKACARAFIKYGLAAKSVSRWFCNKMLYQTTDDMIKALEQAHVSRSIIRQNWHVPYIKNRYIAPDTFAQLPKEIEWMTKLITRMSTASCKKIQAELARSLEQGQSYSQLKTTLMGLKGMDEKRAARVARDQSCKLNQFIQRENALSLGVKEAIWIHVPGMFTSRETHIAMNRKKFDLVLGMMDNSAEAGGRFVHPGELPYCRCICQPIIPDELLE